MRYKILGRTGLRVSALALGTGNFGTGWGYGAEREAAAQVYRAYRDAGGNLVDTADQYQFGQSEAIVGELVAGERDDVVLATKCSLGASRASGPLATGNSRKVMRASVEASLKRLATDRVDLLWVHFPDGVTPVDEIARGLDDLVRAGKVLYAGFSNFPAWRVASAATLAELRGWAPVAAIQAEYSLVERTAERELLPMAAAFGLGVLGWSPLGGGLLTGKYREGATGRAQGLGAVIHAESDARKTAALDAVLALAADTGHSPGRVAIAWALAKGIVPIVGPRTVEQAKDNLGAVDVALTAAQLERLDAASATPPGYPHELNADPRNRQRLAGGMLDRIDPPATPVR